MIRLQKDLNLNVLKVKELKKLCLLNHQKIQVIVKI